MSGDWYENQLQDHITLLIKERDALKHENVQLEKESQGNFDLAAEWTTKAVTAEEQLADQILATHAALVRVAEVELDRDLNDGLRAGAEELLAAAEAERDAAKYQTNQISSRLIAQRRRLSELEAIVADHATHYRFPIEKAAEAARTHIVAWQEQYWRAENVRKALRLLIYGRITYEEAKETLGPHERPE